MTLSWSSFWSCLVCDDGVVEDFMWLKGLLSRRDGGIEGPVGVVEAMDEGGGV